VAAVHNQICNGAAVICRQGSTQAFRYPPAGGCGITVGRNPYRGAAKPLELRPPAPVIGNPLNVCDPGSAAAAPPKLLTCNVAGLAVVEPAAVQVCGTDKAPIEAAFPTAPVTPPPPPSPAPGSVAGSAAGAALAALAAPSAAWPALVIPSRALEERPSISLKAVAKSRVGETSRENMSMGVPMCNSLDPLSDPSKSPSIPSPKSIPSRILPMPLTAGWDGSPESPDSAPGNAVVSADSACVSAAAGVPIAWATAAPWAARPPGLVTGAGSVTASTSTRPPMRRHSCTS
jgi:hypothetical protein